MPKTIKFISIALMLLMSVSAIAQPKRELRSVWMTAMGIDWPQRGGVGATAETQAAAKAQMIEYLDNFKQHNFNGICLQVRPLADALYRSSYEPWSASVSGTRGVDPGWDPLEWVVEECHKRGLECYAWINPFRINNNGKVYGTDCDLEWRKKGWELKSGKWTIFNPAIPEAREHCLKVMKEVYSNYDIDGMLFDDYFYPGDGTPEDETAGDYEHYKAFLAATDTVLSIADWRRYNVHTFIKEIYDAIQVDRPDMRFGISPAGTSGDSAHEHGLKAPEVGSDWAYAQIYCDPLAWLSQGTIDFISPQIYWSRANKNSPYEPLAKWWSEMAKHFNRHNYISIGSYKLGSEFGGDNAAGWTEVDAQVEISRKYAPFDCPGQIYFNARPFDHPDKPGLGDYLEGHSYKTLSLTPVVTWKDHVVYEAPASAAFDGKKLTWTAAKADEKAIIRYTTYAVPAGMSLQQAMSADGDGISAEYLMGVSYSTSYDVPADKRGNFWYAVCVYDGYGYESTPAIIK